MKNLSAILGFLWLAVLTAPHIRAEVYSAENSVIFVEDDRVQALPRANFRRAVMVGNCAGSMVWKNLVLTTFSCLQGSGVLQETAEGNFVLAKKSLQVDFRFEQPLGHIKAPTEEQRPYIVQGWWPSQHRDLSKFNAGAPVLNNLTEIFVRSQQNWALLELNSNLGDFLGYFTVEESFTKENPQFRALHMAYYLPSILGAELVTHTRPCRVFSFSSFDSFYHGCDVHVNVADGAPLWTFDEKTSEAKLVGMHLQAEKLDLPEIDADSPAQVKTVVGAFSKFEMLRPPGDDPRKIYLLMGLSSQAFYPKLRELIEARPRGYVPPTENTEKLKFNFPKRKIFKLPQFDPKTFDPAEFNWKSLDLDKPSQLP